MVNTYIGKLLLRDHVETMLNPVTINHVPTQKG